jgi:ribosomal protein S18 acetylase RimI-like enzyme
MEFKDSRIKWVDTKITFEKNLKNPLENPEIRPYHGELLKELEDLAYLSGTYSRFNTDQRLKNEEFKKLYKIWIKKGIESNQILVAPNMAGMVTYSVEKELGRIGLIAVSEKHQNQGLGKKLIQAVEFQTFQEGAKTMQISTQEQNVSTCRLCQSLNYNLVEKVFVYNWWNSFSLRRQ